MPNELEKLLTQPARSYIRDTKAIAGTVVDIVENSKSYSFITDMPDVKISNIKVSFYLFFIFCLLTISSDTESNLKHA
jgi:HSP20 family molecular chaperone IbpA